MTYPLNFSITLGGTSTGLTLEAQMVDNNGANVGSPITTGFVEIGNGNYLWHNPAVADNFQGGVVFRISPFGTIKAFTEVNLTDQPTLVSYALDNIIIEPGVNARQALSIISAVLAGVLQQQNCPGNGLITIKGLNNPGTNRVTAQTTNGSRVNITLNLP